MSSFFRSSHTPGRAAEFLWPCADVTVMPPNRTVIAASDSLHEKKRSYNHRGEDETGDHENA